MRNNYVKNYEFGHWFRGHLKALLSGALAALLFGGAEPFMQFYNRASWGTFM